MPNSVKIGSFIRTKREALKLSQERLGQMVGVSKNTVWAWEKGKHSVDAAHVQPLALALKVPRTSLIPDAEAPVLGEGPHVSVVSDYLDSPRGKDVKPWVAEQLLEGSCFDAISRLGGEIGWEDVELMRQMLERRAPESVRA